MNERIYKLAREADKLARIEIPDLREIVLYDRIRDEKFAELIVRECAGLFPNVYVEIENEHGHTPVIAADYMKKHFGVGE